jgi:hypothetical protein
MPTERDADARLEIDRYCERCGATFRVAASGRKNQLLRLPFGTIEAAVDAEHIAQTASCPSCGARSRLGLAKMFAAYARPLAWFGAIGGLWGGLDHRWAPFMFFGSVGGLISAALLHVRRNEHRDRAEYSEIQLPSPALPFAGYRTPALSSRHRKTEI